MQAQEGSPSRGDQPLHRSVEVTHVRGIIVSVVRRAMLEQLSGEAWQRCLDGLSPACRAVFARGVGDYEWVPMPLLSEASGHFQASTEGDLVALRGSLYAEQMLTRSHQWMLKVMTPELLVRQAPRIFGFYHQGGQVWTEEVAPGRACLSLRATGPGPGWAEVLMPSWFRRALELCGAKKVEVAYEPPSEDRHHHRYWAVWA
ncbi:MAG TPA: hypothetical protein VJ600_07105 [Holophagaceae bacterium]|nr:hypothetical protein [Holophagaceae bacterium]